MKYGEVKNIPLILAFITASLYTYGITYHQGYLSYWGLPDGLFPLSFEHTLFKGFIATSHLGANTVLPLVLVAVGLFALAVLSYWLFRLPAIRKLLDKLPKPKTSPAASVANSLIADKNVRYSGIVFAVTYWVLVTFVGMLLLLTVAGHFGKESAKQQFANMATKTQPSTICHKVKGEYLAYPVICSVTHCALYRNNHIEIVPLGDISEIVIDKK